MATVLLAVDDDNETLQLPPHTKSLIQWTVCSMARPSIEMEFVNANSWQTGRCQPCAIAGILAVSCHLNCSAIVSFFEGCRTSTHRQQWDLPILWTLIPHGDCCWLHSTWLLLQPGVWWEGCSLPLPSCKVHDSLPLWGFNVSHSPLWSRCTQLPRQVLGSLRYDSCLEGKYGRPL